MPGNYPAQKAAAVIPFAVVRSVGPAIPAVCCLRIGLTSFTSGGLLSMVRFEYALKSNSIGMSILQSIFRRSRPDQRGIDQLIFDLAEHGNRPADVSELYRRLPQVGFFAKVVSANFPIRNGTRHTIHRARTCRFRAHHFPGGTTWLSSLLIGPTPVSDRILSAFPRARLVAWSSR